MNKGVGYCGEACELEQRGTGRKKNITRKLYKGIIGVSIILIRRKKDKNSFKNEI